MISMFTKNQIEQWGLLLELSSLYRKYDLGDKEIFVQKMLEIKQVSKSKNKISCHLE